MNTANEILWHSNETVFTQPVLSYLLLITKMHQCSSATQTVVCGPVLVRGPQLPGSGLTPEICISYLKIHEKINEKNI